MQDASTGTLVTTIIGAILVIALIFVLVPLMTIWSLNVLFHLNIPFAIDTWIAASWLGGLVGHRVFNNSK
jgi:hypothetical protein